MRHQPPFSVRSLGPGRRPRCHVLLAVLRRADSISSYARHQIYHNHLYVLQVVVVEFVVLVGEILAQLVHGNDILLGEEKDGVRMRQPFQFGSWIGRSYRGPKSALLGDDLGFDALVNGRHFCKGK